MRTSLYLPLALALAASPLHAAVDRTKKPEPDPAPAASFPDYTTVTLPNGLKVFVIQDDRKPTITFRLIVKGGSANEGDKTGLAAFAASLLNRGTTTRDAQTFAQQCDYIGVRLEGMAGADAISVGAGGLTKYTEKILELFSDAVLRPVFPADQLAREQRKALSALEAEKQEPDRLAEKLAGKVIFGQHPYGAYRTVETVKAASRDELVKFHETYFVPNNATLAIVGDVKPEEVLPLVEKAFGAWQKKEVPMVKLPGLPEVKGVTVHLVDRPGSVQSNISVCKPGPARDNPDMPELNVVNATLGGGFSGRLFQNLREKNGWTYGAYSAFGMNKVGGSFSASAETRNEVTAPAVTEIIKEMKRLSEEPVPAEELSLQQQYNVGNYLLSLENSARIATRVQDIDLYNLPADFYKVYARRMATVSAPQVEKLSKQYLGTEDLAIVVVGEAKDIKPGLEKIGKVVVYDQELKPVATP